MVVRLRFFSGLLLILLIVVGCARLNAAPPPPQIALLAPFEGRYREIGYEALYAARLAIAENNPDVALLPIDDGSTVESATQRVLALQRDSKVQALIATGPYATQPHVQAELTDLPMLIVGYWPSEPTSQQIFVLGRSQIAERVSGTGWEAITTAARLPAPFTGGDVLSVDGFRALRADLNGVQIVSSGTLPTEDFRQRFLESDPFAAEPGLLATQIYDAASIMLQAMKDDADRETITAALQNETFTVTTGTMHFSDGYWSDAPINTFTFDASGALILANPTQ